MSHGTRQRKNIGKLPDRCRGCELCRVQKDREKAENWERKADAFESALNAKADSLVQHATEARDYALEQRDHIKVALASASGKFKHALSAENLTAVVDRADDRIYQGLEILQNQSNELAANFVEWVDRNRSVSEYRRVNNSKTYPASTKAVTGATIAAQALMMVPSPQVSLASETESRVEISEALLRNMPEVVSVKLMEDGSNVIQLSKIGESVEFTPTEISTALTVSNQESQPAVEPESFSYDGIEEPMIRTLHDKKGPVVFGHAMLGKGADPEDVLGLTAKILEHNGYPRPTSLEDLKNEVYKEIPAGTPFELPIEMAGKQVLKVEDGKTNAQLRTELGYPVTEAGLAQFMQDNAIPERDEVIGGWKVIVPTAEVVTADNNSQVSATVETEVPVAPVEPSATVETTPAVKEENIEEQVEAPAPARQFNLSLREDVEAAVDQVIATVAKIENPYGRHSNEPAPATPTADKLANQREQLINKIVDGQTNPSFVQSQAFMELSLANSDMDVLDIARLATRSAYSRRGIIPSQAQVETQAELLIAGISDPASIINSGSINDRVQFDNASRGIYELDAELEAQVATEVANLRNDQVFLDEVGYETVDTDVEILAKQIISHRNQESLQGDSLYYLLRNELGSHDQTMLEYATLQIVTRVHESLDAQALIENDDYAASLVASVETLSAEDYVDLGLFLESQEDLLATQLETAAARVIQIVDNVSAATASTDVFSTEEVAMLSIDSILGADDGYLTVEALELSAENQQLELNAPLGEYITQSFKNAGIAGYLDDGELASLTAEYLAAWNQRDASEFSFEFAPEAVAAEVIGQTMVSLLEQVEPHIGDAEIVADTPELRDIAIKYLNSPDINQAELEINLLNAIGSDYASSLAMIDAYLQDYYQSRIFTETSRENVIRAIAMEIADGHNPADYLSEAFIGEVERYTDPAKLFPGGVNLYMEHNTGQDLRAFLAKIGVDPADILSSPLNAHITQLEDGSIVSSEYDSLWIPPDAITDTNIDINKIYNIEFAPITGTPYEVVKGDSLSIIAARYGRTWQELAAHNDIPEEEADELDLEQKIFIPYDFVLLPKNIVIGSSEADSQPETASSSEVADYFNITGAEIKAMLKSAAPEGKSGYLDSGQLEKLGGEWGDKVLYPDAAESFRMMSEAFEAEFGHPLEVISTYRSYEGQVETKKWWTEQGKPNMAATPGNSNHGWGLAIDFGDQDMDGPDGAALKFSQPEYAWMEANMAQYGWETPAWADDGKGIEEAWHKEYVGKPNVEQAITPEVKSSQTEISQEYADRFPEQEQYEPGSEAYVDLFEAAADYLGLPREWAQSEGLEKLVERESGGWVGIPNYTYEAERDEWDNIHEDLKDGEIKARSSANGLGQLIRDNVVSHYPSGVEGYGIAFEEAVGMLSYIKQRYETPEIAWGNHGANPDRWEGVPKIYEAEGY